MPAETDIRNAIEGAGQDPYRELDLRLDLRNALERLTAYDLLIIYHVFNAQTSYTDLAAILGITPQAVRRQVQRILQEIRERLDE